MKLVEESPHFKATTRDGSAWMLRVDLHDDFLATWTAGKAFWAGHTASHDRITIKLTDIVAVTLWDEAAIARLADERAEIKSRELTEGPAQ